MWIIYCERVKAIFVKESSSLKISKLTEVSQREQMNE